MVSARMRSWNVLNGPSAPFRRTQLAARRRPLLLSWLASAASQKELRAGRKHQLGAARAPPNLQSPARSRAHRNKKRARRAAQRASTFPLRTWSLCLHRPSPASGLAVRCSPTRMRRARAPPPLPWTTATGARACGPTARRAPRSALSLLVLVPACHSLPATQSTGSLLCTQWWCSSSGCNLSLR